MLALFLIYGVATIAMAVILLLSLVVGGCLCISKRFRNTGIFVLLVPTLAALAAGSGSWSLLRFFMWMSKGATSLGPLQRLEALTFWAWPTGFVGGGIVGAQAGILVALLVVRRRQRRALPAEAT